MKDQHVHTVRALQGASVRGSVVRALFISCMSCVQGLIDAHEQFKATLGEADKEYTTIVSLSTEVVRLGQQYGLTPPDNPYTTLHAQVRPPRLAGSPSRGRALFVLVLCFLEPSHIGVVLRKFDFVLGGREPVFWVWNANGGMRLVCFWLLVAVLSFMVGTEGSWEIYGRGRVQLTLFSWNEKYLGGLKKNRRYLL